MDERKEKILQAIVDDYIASAEPVGSRALIRKHDLGISAATVRNEMADLEMLGYLEHIHTSSGRVPSSKGYRFYVDGLQISEVSPQEQKKIERWYKARVKRIDEVFQETAKLISEVTHNVTLLLAPEVGKAAFRCMHFLPLDEERAIAVLMTDAGFVENKIMDMPCGATFKDLQELAAVVNERLAGKTLPHIQKTAMREIADAIADDNLYDAAAEIIESALNSSKKERLYLGGGAYITEQPEFHDAEKIKDILLMLEEEELIKDIMRSHLSDGLSVTICEENEADRLKDCSMITASYHLGGELLGAMTVLGPRRMNYDKAMAILNYMNTNLSRVIGRFRW